VAGQLASASLIDSADLRSGEAARHSSLWLKIAGCIYLAGVVTTAAILTFVNVHAVGWELFFRDLGSLHTISSYASICLLWPIWWGLILYAWIFNVQFES
jgi:hypothetical protein